MYLECKLQETLGNIWTGLETGASIGNKSKCGGGLRKVSTGKPNTVRFAGLVGEGAGCGRCDAIVSTKKLVKSTTA